MSGPFDFLHIKGRTAGSSNELSFDVLDAARNGLDNQKSRSTRAMTGPKPSQGSYHGVAGTATFSAAPEVARRKRERCAHSTRIGLIVAVLLVTVLAFAGYAGYSFYREATTFAGRFNAIIGQLVELDASLVQVDSLMNDPLNSVEIDKRAEMAARFPQLDASLARVSDDAAQLGEDAMGQVEGDRLEAVRQAAQARRDMLATADDAFTLSDEVNGRVAAANSAWDQVIGADVLAREAASVANGASTEEATLQGRELTEQAIQGLQQARDGLVAVEQEMGEEVLAAEKAYIDKRIESLESAVQTADALLENDREAATTANDAYNAADREAASMASGLAASPGEVIKTYYSPDMQACLDAYAQARAAASAADSEVRNS